MSYDHGLTESAMVYLEDHANTAQQHLKHAHDAINEAAVIVAGGEMPSLDKIHAITTAVNASIWALGQAGNDALYLQNQSAVFPPEPKPADIEHDIAEQRWKEDRDLSAVDR